MLNSERPERRPHGTLVLAYQKPFAAVWFPGVDSRTPTRIDAEQRASRAARGSGCKWRIQDTHANRC
jgi:hypothetical protein